MDRPPSIESTLFQAVRLNRYARHNPNKVFKPACFAMKSEEKKCLAGTRQPTVPWFISNHYQETDPFWAMTMQKAEAENKKPLKVGKIKRKGKMPMFFF